MLYTLWYICGFSEQNVTSVSNTKLLLRDWRPYLASSAKPLHCWHKCHSKWREKCRHTHSMNTLQWSKYGSRQYHDISSLCYIQLLSCSCSRLEVWQKMQLFSFEVFISLRLFLWYEFAWLTCVGGFLMKFKHSSWCCWIKIECQAKTQKVQHCDSQLPRTVLTGSHRSPRTDSEMCVNICWWESFCSVM